MTQSGGADNTFSQQLSIIFRKVCVCGGGGGGGAEACPCPPRALIVSVVDWFATMSTVLRSKKSTLGFAW